MFSRVVGLSVWDCSDGLAAGCRGDQIRGSKRQFQNQYQ